jgi:ubiquinone biosynthesis protein UbiJ
MKYLVCVGVGPDFRDAYLDSPRIAASFSTTDPTRAHAFDADEARAAVAALNTKPWNTAAIRPVADVLCDEVAVVEQTLARLRARMEEVGNAA